MALQTSYDLASIETRVTYNELVQHVRTMLGKHFPQDELAKQEEEVMKRARNVLIEILQEKMPDQEVSPDCFLMDLGRVLWACCDKRCGTAQKFPVEFMINEVYDPAKGNAPELIRAKQEAAEKEIEDRRKKIEDRRKEKGKEVAAPPARQMPNMSTTPAWTRQLPLGHGVTPGESQAGPSNKPPPSLSRSMWARRVVEDDNRIYHQRVKEAKEREDRMGTLGSSLAHGRDQPVVEKYTQAKVDERGVRHIGEVQHLQHGASAHEQKKAVQIQPVRIPAPTPSSNTAKTDPDPSQGPKGGVAALLPGQKAQLMCKNNVDRQFAAGVAAASAQVSKPGPSRAQHAPRRAYIFGIPDSDDEFMDYLWERYDLGGNWPLQGELRPWEVKIVASSGDLAFGANSCHRNRIFEFMALKGPGKIYTRVIRNDWLVMGITVQKIRRGSSKDNVSPQFLASLVDVYSILYEWAQRVAEGSRQSLVEAMDDDSMQILRARGAIDERKEEDKKEGGKKEGGKKKDDSLVSHEDVKGKGKQVAEPVKQVPDTQGKGKDAEERQQEVQIVRDHVDEVLGDVKGGALRREKLIAFVEGSCGDLKHLAEAEIVDVIRDHWENGTLYKGEKKEKMEARDFAKHFTKEEKKTRAVSKAKRLVTDVVAREPVSVEVAKSRRVASLLKEVKNWGMKDILSQDEVAAYMFNTYKSLYPSEREQQEAQHFKECYSTLKKKWESHKAE
ncbi:hypothetical protein VMCG_10235 [Cytospora schulzeri]|uniref:Uncharacterized protein n=1 Tax=Cytospora schulzeri TaxID=448051 RepID=A0A423VF40_9PEZI|nr:hypothetical protein VMCG_10235 [Valsa malicola]